MSGQNELPHVGGSASRPASRLKQRERHEQES